jgi:hypothetical protein
MTEPDFAEVSLSDSRTAAILTTLAVRKTAGVGIAHRMAAIEQQPF